MLAIFLLTAFLVIRTGPATYLGQALRRGLVDWPAERLNRLTRGRLVTWLCLGLLLWGAAVVLGGEALRLLSMAMPETLAWLAMFDFSVVADLLIAASLVAAQTRLRGVSARLRAVLARRTAPRARAPRRRRTAAPKAGNDDEPAPAFAMAA